MRISGFAVIARTSSIAGHTVTYRMLGFFWHVSTLTQSRARGPELQQGSGQNDLLYFIPERLFPQFKHLKVHCGW